MKGEKEWNEYTLLYIYAHDRKVDMREGGFFLQGK